MEDSDLHAKPTGMEELHDASSKHLCVCIVPGMVTFFRMENIKHPAGESHLLPPLPVHNSLSIKLLAYKS